MKKLISVLLAVLMVFSLVTVAFAADGDAEENNNAAFNSIVKALIGDGSIENVPLGTAKAGLKIAKIFLKLAKAFIKVGDALGFIDGDKIFMDLVNSVAGMLNKGDEEKPTEPASQPTSGAPAEPTTQPAGESDPTTQPAGETDPTTQPAGETDPTTQPAAESDPATQPADEPTTGENG